MTLAVIPLGRGRPGSLPYALRALETHAGVTEVWTVGERPEKVTPDRHVDSPNNRPAGYLNVQAHLELVLPDILDPFIWTSDDIFTLTPWTPGVYVRKDTLAEHLRTYANKGHYTRAVKASTEIVRALGYDPETTPTGAGHRPWLVEPFRTRDALKAVDEHGAGWWMFVYVAGLEGVIPSGNSKIHAPHQLVAKGADMASTGPQSWRRNAGRQIREMFPTPSRWEP